MQFQDWGTRLRDRGTLRHHGVQLRDYGMQLRNHGTQLQDCQYSFRPRILKYLPARESRDLTNSQTAIIMPAEKLRAFKGAMLGASLRLKKVEEHELKRRGLALLYTFSA
jgi:hypothetical protein